MNFKLRNISSKKYYKGINFFNENFIKVIRNIYILLDCFLV